MQWACSLRAHWCLFVEQLGELLKKKKLGCMWGPREEEMSNLGYRGKGQLGRPRALSGLAAGLPRLVLLLWVSSWACSELGKFGLRVGPVMGSNWAWAWA